MTNVIVLALIVTAAVLSVIDLARSKGQSLSAWGVLMLAVALLIEGGVV